jgi:trehalose-phosphatase
MTDVDRPSDRARLVRALEGFVAQGRVLVAMDFDGTLAPIVEDPDAARPLPQAVQAVRALAALPRTHVAVVSGRPRAHLRRLLDPPDGMVVVGSHGAEVDEDDPLDDDELALLARLHDAVVGLVKAHPGTQLEEKPTAVVLHTRTADRDQARAATREALEGPARWPGVHVMRGKEVVELAVTDMTKGRALQRLRADLGLERGGVFFAGDDATDERAFAVLDDDGGDVTVKVGEGRTEARHRVAGPGELADVLALVARGREAR